MMMFPLTRNTRFISVRGTNFLYLDAEETKMTSKEQVVDSGEPRSRSNHSTLRLNLPNRWLVCLIVMAGTAVGMFVLPSPVPYLCLIALVIAGLLVAAHDAALSPADVRQGLHEFQAGTLRIRTLASHETGKVHPRDRRWLYVFTGAACGLMVLAAIAFRPSDDNQPLGLAVLLTVLGGAALATALRFAPEAVLLRQPTVDALAPARARLGFVILGVLLLALVAEISGHLLEIVLLKEISIHVQVALWVLGIVLVTMGMAGVSGLPAAAFRRPLAAFTGWLASLDRAAVLPVIGVFALALVIRLWDVGNTVRSPIDEEHFMHVVIGLENDSNRGLLEPALGNLLASPGIYTYWQWWSVQLFGHNFFALRIISVIVGSLTISALYLLASSLFDRKTALIAALLLATFPPHVHFSRLALSQVADALFGTLALGFLARGFKYNRRTDWALAGASIALTQYFYEAARLFFVPLVVLSVIVLALVRWRQMQSHWHGLMVATLTALFVTAPIYYTLYALDLPLTTRFAESGLGASYWTELLQNGLTGDAIGRIIGQFTAPFEIYVHQPEIRHYFFYYGGQQPMVLVFLVPLFLLGIFYILWRWRTPAIVVLLWVAGVALGNGLLREIFTYPRWVLVLPAVALVMAVGIRYVLTLLWPSDSRMPVAVPLTALMVSIAIAQTAYYFNEHLPFYQRQIYYIREESDGYDAVLRTAELPLAQNVQIVLIAYPTPDRGLYVNFERFIRGDMMPEMYIRSAASTDITPEYLAALPTDRRYAFFIEPQDTSALNAIQQVFSTDAPVGSPYSASIPDEREFQLVYAYDRR
jgi:hypothetical protein